MKCANKECAIEFNPKTHNQKYHNDECCRVATNRIIMEKYYEKKAIRGGSVRNCENCKTLLSRYNQKNICSACEKNNKITNKKMLLGILDEIG